MVDKSSRGFLQGGPIPSEYGGSIRAYESSSAEGPHLWVRIECPVDFNNPDGERKDAVVHLTLENAKALEKQLRHLRKHHYQVKPR